MKTAGAASRHTMRKRRLYLGGLLAVVVAGAGISLGTQPPEIPVEGMLLQSLQWPESLHDPGGLSGLAITASGTALTAVTDHGQLVEAVIQRDDAGRILSVDEIQARRLLPPEQANWPDNWYHRDAEGLAILHDGTLAVSFEGLHRVNLHDRAGNFVRWIEVFEAFSNLEVNSGLEALAVTAEGTLLALPEAWDPDPGRLPLFRFDGTEWQVGAWISATPGFNPVGLDIDSDGWVYLLERSFRLTSGFRTQIRRFSPTDLETLAEPVTGEVLLRTESRDHGNLEGISLWRRPDGTRIATLVADNNSRRYLRRELVEYQLPAP